MDRWLAAVAQRSQVEGLVLADENGLLVAASMQGPQAADFAAEARKAADNPLGATLHNMIVDRKACHGEALFLAVLGDPGRALPRIAEVWAGVQRILCSTETLPGPFSPLQ